MLKASLYALLPPGKYEYECKKDCGTHYDSTTAVRIAKWCDPTFTMAMISFKVNLSILKCRWKANLGNQDEGKNRKWKYWLPLNACVSLKRTYWRARQEDCVQREDVGSFIGRNSFRYCLASRFHHGILDRHAWTLFREGNCIEHIMIDHACTTTRLVLVGRCGAICKVQMCTWCAGLEFQNGLYGALE